MSKPHLMLLVALVACGGCASLERESLRLADGAKTDYVIVSKPGVEEDFAVKELQDFLRQSTGTDFVRVNVDDAGKHPHRIIIGDNALSRRLLGDDTVNSLKPEESLVAVKGSDLVLVGGGGRGALYAVYSFLENEVGCRWYTAYRDIVVPQHPTLTIGALNRREKPAFTTRMLSTYYYQIRPDKDLFFFRNRLNGNISTYENCPALRDALPHVGPSCHTVFFYMNPGSSYHEAWKSFPKPSLSSLFETHPEFYSMNAEGKRVKNLQLCFSNPQMRKTLTGQIEDVIGKTGLSKGMLTLDAEDVPGKFCHCPECLKLEKKYATIAGPILDYLIELCAYLKDKHPDFYVKTLAYRKAQSEIPPQNIERLPDNLIICFAPIDKNFAAPLNHPSNKDTLDNLKGWTRMARNVWVWNYSNPYCPLPPFGNIEMLRDDVVALKEAGVNGTYFEHGSGVAVGLNFPELQTWLYLRLFQDTNADAGNLIREFTDYYYGKAAPMMRNYMNDLESVRKGMGITLPWNPSLSMFGYLTPERLVRWEKEFDQMEELVKDSPACLRHVRTCRITLDTATLYKWHDVKKYSKDLSFTAQGLHKRIMANFEEEAKCRFPKDAAHWRNSLEKTTSQMLLQAEVDPKPLPAFFNTFPPDSVKQAFPSDKLQKDPEAACGVAVGGKWSEAALDLGLYDNYNAKWSIANKIAKDEIKPDQYAVYKLGRSVLTPQCLVWVTTGWVATVPVEQFYIVGEPFVKWDIYASLKFEGPLYGSADKAKQNRILCDRVILVKVDE